MLDIDAQLSASIEVFYGVRNSSVSDMHIVDAARQIADAGYGVEVLIAEGWMDRSLPSDDTISRLAEVGKQAKYMTAHASVNAWDPDAIRDEILIAARMGMSQIVVHPYVLGEGPEGPSEPQDQARDICRFALDNGVLLVLENLGLTGIESMRRSIEAIGASPCETGLAVCIDVGHANRTCTNDGIRPEEYLREFRDLIRDVHVDDNFGTKDLHLPPGQGGIDWPPVIAAMLDLPDDAIVCLEIACPNAPMEALNDARDFLLAGAGRLGGCCSNA